MWTDDRIFREDLDSIISDAAIDFERLRNRTVLVTGATGLIGFWCVSALLYADKRFGLGLRVIANARNPEKAQKMYAGLIEDTGLPVFVYGDVAHFTVDEKVDHIIHAAAQTNSRAMVEQPVETLLTAINGTLNILRLADQKHSESVVYLSSMEVYGTHDSDDKMAEDCFGRIDPLQIRSSYPEGKRACENLVAGFASEYGVNGKVIRLAQTFGPGLDKNDRRIFAQFARNAIDKEDIVIHTSGQSKRVYLYTADAVRGILLILFNGEAGQAYNLANESTYSSILEVAHLIADECAQGEIKVIVENRSSAEFGFAPISRTNLDVSKASGLGFEARYDLLEMLKRTIESMKQG